MIPRDHWVDTKHTNLTNTKLRDTLEPATWLHLLNLVIPTENNMDASAIMRKVKELDALEKRLRQTVNPSQVLLKQIQEERNNLLNPQEKK